MCPIDANASVGLGLPLVWLETYAFSLRKQAKAMRLPRPVYTIKFNESGVTCYPPEVSAAPEHTPWADVYGAWRRPDAVYFYVQSGKAYLLPEGEERQADKIWAILVGHLTKEKLHK